MIWFFRVPYFHTEHGIEVVERELIRRYRPQINWAHNTGRPRTAIEEAQLRSSIIGPACRFVIETGWPSFHDIALESRADHPQPARRRRRLTADERRTGAADAVGADRDATQA